jgi:hypothetical protein
MAATNYRTGDLGSVDHTSAGLGVRGAMRTPADLNKRLREHYAEK